MRSPGHPFAIICAFALSIGTARAAGVAVLKEQIYHRDCSARVVAYSRIIDSHGPYLRIVSGRVNVDILRSKLVGRVELPDPVPLRVMEEKDVRSLRESLAEMRGFLARYPQSAPWLADRSAAIAAHLNRFDAGEVRFEGAWMSKNTLADIFENRRQQEENHELMEVEKRVFAAAQQDNGLLLWNGRWMTPQEVQQLPPGSPTELSESIEPLRNGDLGGAEFAVKNLSSLASQQIGAPKVRTERLLTIVRNLFLAETHLSNQIITSTADAHAAAIQEKNAADWRKPNAFGTVTQDAARDSSRKAAQIRQHSSDELASRKQELLDQIREAQVVVGDFKKLGEQRVAVILGEAARAVESRHFTDSEIRRIGQDGIL